MRNIIRGSVFLALVMGMLAAFAPSANATQHAKEVQACWSMDNPNLGSPSTYEWPQTRVDCSTVPEKGSHTQSCEGAKWQVDFYWIRNQDDQDYLDNLKTMQGPQDDARLSPHGYYAVTQAANPFLCQPPDQDRHRKVTSKVDCDTHTVTVSRQESHRSFVWQDDAWVPGPWSPWVTTSTHTRHVGHVQECEVNRHAVTRVHITDKCNCFADKVTLSYNPNRVKVYREHPTKLTWKFTVVGKKIGDRQFLVPLKYGTHRNYTLVTEYVFHTTNVACPCHKTHTCHHSSAPHPPHCPTPGKLNGKPCHR